MMDLTILCAYVPGHRAVETSPATLAIMKIERFYPVQWVECHAPTDYAAAISGFWRCRGDLLIIEHDMAPTLSMVEDLLTCPYDACAQAYWLAPASTGQLSPMLSADQGSIVHGADHANYSAIGLCKLSERLRSRTGPPRQVSWRDVEPEINRAVSGQWHVHWPCVDHYHGFSRGRIGNGRRIYAAAAGGAD